MAKFYYFSSYSMKLYLDSSFRREAFPAIFGSRDLARIWLTDMGDFTKIK